MIGRAELLSTAIDHDVHLPSRPESCCLRYQVVTVFSLRFVYASFSDRNRVCVSTTMVVFGQWRSDACGIVSDTALAACRLTHDNKRVEVEPSPHSGLAIRACKARYGKCPGALKFCSDVMIESRVWLVLSFFRFVLSDARFCPSAGSHPSWA